MADVTDMLNNFNPNIVKTKPDDREVRAQKQQLLLFLHLHNFEEGREGTADIQHCSTRTHSIRPGDPGSTQ